MCPVSAVCRLRGILQTALQKRNGSCQQDASEENVAGMEVGIFEHFRTGYFNLSLSCSRLKEIKCFALLFSIMPCPTLELYIEVKQLLQVLTSSKGLTDTLKDY